MAQLNLGQLSAFETLHPIPASGLLSFYYHDSEGHPEGADSVIHFFEDLDSLVRTPVVVDPRFGERFHKEHLFARRFAFSQKFAIEEELDFEDEEARFVEQFNFRFARATHRLFGLPRYWTAPQREHITRGSFGEWADRINFSVPLSGLQSLDFSALQVDYLCT